jgi:hypothetical protein
MIDSISNVPFIARFLTQQKALGSGMIGATSLRLRAFA